MTNLLSPTGDVPSAQSQAPTIRTGDVPSAQSQAPTIRTGDIPSAQSQAPTIRTGDVAAQSQAATLKPELPKKRSFIKLISGAMLLVIVGVGAFYLGSQWNKLPRENQGAITTPVSSDAAEPTMSGQARTGTPDTTATTQPAASQPTTPTDPNAPPTTLREQPTASSQPAHPPEKRRTTDAPPTATESPVKAKTKSTTSAKEYYDRGIEDLNAGRYDAALEKFEQVKRLSPDNKDVYYLIGQAYHKSKRLAEALRAYEQCTSGPYASLAAQHVKALSKQLKKSN